MNLAALNTAAVHAATMFLAQPEGADPGGRGEGFGKSTPLGLLLMIVLLIAVALLVRSMTKHLKRVPGTFDPDAETDETSDSADGGDDGQADADEPSAEAADDADTRDVAAEDEAREKS